MMPVAGHALHGMHDDAWAERTRFILIIFFEYNLVQKKTFYVYPAFIIFFGTQSSAEKNILCVLSPPRQGGEVRYGTSFCW